MPYTCWFAGDHVEGNSVVLNYTPPSEGIAYLRTDHVPWLARVLPTQDSIALPFSVFSGRRYLVASKILACITKLESYAQDSGFHSGGVHLVWNRTEAQPDNNLCVVLMAAYSVKPLGLEGLEPKIFDTLDEVEFKLSVPFQVPYEKVSRYERKWVI